MQLVCPSCGTKNRMPEGRLQDDPLCGHCGVPLMEAKPLALDDRSFDGFIQGTELPVLVDYWADWCAPCRTMAPQFEAAASMLEPQVRLGKVDTEAEPALGSRFAIRSIPTMVLVHQGREVGRQSGAMGTEQIVRWARSQLPR